MVEWYRSQFNRILLYTHFKYHPTCFFSFIFNFHLKWYSFYRSEWVLNLSILPIVFRNKRIHWMWHWMSAANTIEVHHFPLLSFFKKFHWFCLYKIKHTTQIFSDEVTKAIWKENEKRKINKSSQSHKKPLETDSIANKRSNKRINESKWIRFSEKENDTQIQFNAELSSTERKKKHRKDEQTIRGNGQRKCLMQLPIQSLSKLDATTWT